MTYFIYLLYIVFSFTTCRLLEERKVKGKIPPFFQQKTTMFHKLFFFITNTKATCRRYLWFDVVFKKKEKLKRKLRIVKFQSYNKKRQCFTKCFLLRTRRQHVVAIYGLMSFILKDVPS